MRTPKIDCHIHLRTPLAVGEMRAVFRLLGIEKGIIMTAPPDVPVDISIIGNEAAAHVCAEDPVHFGWFCSVLPGSRNDVMQQLERCKRAGALGVGELMSNLPVDDERLQAVYSCCGALSMPVTFHMSPAVGLHYGVVDEPGLPRLERMLQLYPQTIFVGHSQLFWNEIDAARLETPGERYGYPAGPVREGRLQQLLAAYPNLRGDLSANSAGNALMRDPDHALRFLPRFRNKLLFGTDHSSAANLYPLSLWLDQMVNQGKLAQEVYDDIVRGNAVKLLGL